MMLYSIIPSEIVMLNLQNAECKTDLPQAVLSTNPQDFLSATEVKIRN